MQTNVIIIGGGYAGVMAANRLAGHRAAGLRARVVMVSPTDSLVERIRLHEALTDPVPPTVPLRDLLHGSVELVVARATLVDRGHSVVRLDDGRSLAFDRVVIATGSASAGAASHHGARVYPLASLAELGPLKHALASAPKGAAVRVVGGGFTGIEVAGELARLGHAVEIIDSGTVGGTLHAAGRRRARRLLRQSGCTIVDGERFTPDSRDRTLTVWTAGFRPVTVPVAPPIEMAPDGRYEVDATLRSRSDARILAAGDCAAPPAAHLRASCAAAFPLGAGAGDTIAAELLGGAARPVRVGFVLRCVSVGRRAAVVEVVRPGDGPLGVALGGRVARVVKDWIMDSTTRWLRNESRRSGSYRSMPGPA